MTRVNKVEERVTDIENKLMTKREAEEKRDKQKQKTKKSIMRID